MSKPPVFITGAAGFIGTNLIYKFLNLGHPVHGLVQKTTNLWRLKAILSKIELHHEHLFDLPGLSNLLQKINPKIIIHLAAYGNSPAHKDFNRTINVNVNGTQNLLTATHKINYDVLINTGSSSEYGIKVKPMKETDVLEPVTIYGASKVSATQICRVYAGTFNKPVVTIRPFSAYGPFEEPDRFVPTIINNLINKHPVSLAAGVIRHDYIYINDLVDIYLKTANLKSKASGLVINAGTGREYTNLEVVKTLFEVTGRKVPVQTGAYKARVWDTCHWRADIKYMKKLLKWDKFTTLEKGLAQAYNFYAHFK